MKRLLSIMISITVLILVNACKSGKENNLDETMNQRKNQVPKINNQNPDQPLIKPLSNLTSEQNKIKEQVLQVIKKNLEATEAEDVNGVLATIHEDSPQLQSTKNGMAFIFKNYDMKYKLLDAEVISISNDEVQVYYKQRTEAVKGSGFTNRDAAGIHILKKSKDGKWKIFKTEYL